MWSRNTIRESSHISFFCGKDPLCVLEWWPENIHDMFARVTSRSLPSLERPEDLSFSPKLQTLYCLFKSHVQVWTFSSLHIFFCLWLVIRTYIIRWSYLWTETSVTLSIGNKLYSLPSSFIFFTLLMLSCDCIESPKFIITS